jgi:hypothetical protein
MSQKYLKKILNRYTQTYDTTNSPEIKKNVGATYARINFCVLYRPYSSYLRIQK